MAYDWCDIQGFNPTLQDVCHMQLTVGKRAERDGFVDTRNAEQDGLVEKRETTVENMRRILRTWFVA